jgi:hypothetical protein
MKNNYVTILIYGWTRLLLAVEQENANFLTLYDQDPYANHNEKWLLKLVIRDCKDRSVTWEVKLFTLPSDVMKT